MKKNIPWFIKFWHDHEMLWLGLLFWTEVGASAYRIWKCNCAAMLLGEVMLFPFTLFIMSISYCIIDGKFREKYYPDEEY